MIGSWKLPTLAIAGLVSAVGFLCPACGRSDEAKGPAPGSRPASVAASPAAVPSASVKTIEFDVAGMTCGGCAIATEAALERLDGVQTAEATYDEESGGGRAMIEYDATKITPERLVEAVEAIGFHPTLRSGG